MRLDSFLPVRSFLSLNCNDHSLYSTTTLMRYMAPKYVLRTPPPLPSATIYSSTNGHTTGPTGINVYSFGSYQLMEVGTAAEMISASAALRLLEKFYRKAMVINPFFRTIKKARSRLLLLFCRPGGNHRNLL